MPTHFSIVSTSLNLRTISAATQNVTVDSGRRPLWYTIRPAAFTINFHRLDHRYSLEMAPFAQHHGNLMELPLLCQARYGMISVAHLGVSNAPWFRALPFSVRLRPRCNHGRFGTTSQSWTKFFLLRCRHTRCRWIWP